MNFASWNKQMHTSTLGFIRMLFIKIFVSSIYTEDDQESQPYMYSIFPVFYMWYNTNHSWKSVTLFK